MIVRNQSGVALIIAFLIMTALLSVVLGFSTIIFNKIKILGNIGSSMSTFYASESGIEKTLFYDKKKIPGGSLRGLCNICTSCTDCSSCKATEGVIGGCKTTTCNNCTVTYNIVFNSRTYAVTATVTPSLFLSCQSKATYLNTSKTITINGSSLSGPMDQW